MTNKASKLKCSDKGWLSASHLSLEIEQVGQLLELSCGWLSDLSERLQGVDSTLLEMVSQIEKLKKAPEYRNFNKSISKEIRVFLKDLRLYCRHMADEQGPLTVMDIMEDSECLSGLAEQLNALVKRRKIKVEKD